MEPITISWILVYLGLGAILLELFIGIETGFDLVLIGVALMVGGGVGNMTGNWILGFSATTVLSVAYIFIGRQHIRQKLSIDTQKTNVDSIKDKEGTVIKPIMPGKAGQVQIDTEVWRAISKNKIEKDTRVKVVKVKGVTAYVV